MAKCIVDKGTLDAMTLNPEVQISVGTRVDNIVEKYRNTLSSLLSSERGIFMITSCNWTRDELMSWFHEKKFFSGTTKSCRLRFKEQIEHASYTFGGSSGQLVTTLIFLLEPI